MPIVYVNGPPNEDLVNSLRDSDPLLRAGAAITLADRGDYFALPDLLVAARSDADRGVRDAARVAIMAIRTLPSLQEDRVVTAQPGTAPESVQSTRAEASAATIDTFRAYVDAKGAVGGVGSVFSAIDGVHVAVIDYVEAWGHDSVTDLDEAELAAAMAIRAIAEHINALSLHGHSAIKFLSYKAAGERVATYDAARDRCF